MMIKAKYKIGIAFTIISFLLTGCFQEDALATTKQTKIFDKVYEESTFEEIIKSQETRELKELTIEIEETSFANLPKSENDYYLFEDNFYEIQMVEDKDCQLVEFNLGEDEESEFNYQANQVTNCLEGMKYGEMIYVSNEYILSRQWKTKAMEKVSYALYSRDKDEHKEIDDYKGTHSLLQKVKVIETAEHIYYESVEKTVVSVYRVSKSDYSVEKVSKRSRLVGVNEQQVYILEMRKNNYLGLYSRVVELNQDSGEETELYVSDKYRIATALLKDKKLYVASDYNQGKIFEIDLESKKVQVKADEVVAYELYINSNYMFASSYETQTVINPKGIAKFYTEEERKYIFMDNQIILREELTEGTAVTYTKIKTLKESD